MKSTGLLLSSAALALVAFAAPALADYGTVSAGVTVESDYRYRGISQNAKEITPEATINWSGPDGFYAGTWAAKTNWGGNNPSLEMDFYGGKHFDLDGTDLNIEAYYYTYPDAMYGSKASYFEMIGQLSHTFGPVALTVTGAYSPEWSLDGGTAWYAAGTASYPLTDHLTLSATLGHQWVQAYTLSNGYSHWDVGAAYTWKSWTLDVRYVGNDLTASQCTAFWMSTPNACGDTVKASLSYAIADIFN